MFELVLRRQPKRYLQKTPPAVQAAMADCFRRLEADPYEWSQPLKGELNGYLRARVGSLRVVFRIDLDQRALIVSYIGPRGDVYKRGGQVRG